MISIFAIMGQVKDKEHPMIRITRARDALSAMALFGIVANSAPASANSGHDLGLSALASSSGSHQQTLERSSDRLDGAALGQQSSGSYRLAAAPAPRMTMPAPTPPRMAPVAPAPKVMTAAPPPPAPKVMTAAPAPAKPAPAAPAPAPAGK
jgi:hypothetical protein